MASNNDRRIQCAYAYIDFKYRCMCMHVYLSEMFCQRAMNHVGRPITVKLTACLNSQLSQINAFQSIVINSSNNIKHME